VVAAIDTIWDVVDLYNDARDCFGDSDSMACYMAAAGVAFVAMGALEGPSNNVARRAAKAADVGDAAGDVARRVDVPKSIADNPRLCQMWDDSEILSNVVDQSLLGGEYRWSARKQVVRCWL